MAPLLELLLPMLFNAVLQAVPALVKQYADPAQPNPVPPPPDDPNVAEAIATLATVAAQHIAAQAWQASQDRPHSTRATDLPDQALTPPGPLKVVP